MTEIRIGYIPLTDAAVLIAASARGFAEREGIGIQLEREASWATLRDKLALGVIDAAHMLAPLAIASTLGLGPGAPLDLVAPFALNLNGNAITISARLWSELGLDEEAGPADIATSLAGLVRRRAGDGAASLTLATVFPYSTHTYLLRHFLRLGGIDPDREFRITVVPPPYMVEALDAGVVDGFCVGSPWNSVAVEAGGGRIVALGSDLVPDAPEKVLVWPRDRLPVAPARGLLRALRAAAAWCDAPENRQDLARLLAEPGHLAVDGAILLRTLDGRLPLGRSGPVRSAPDYLRIGGDVHRPDRRSASWIYDRMAEAGQVHDGPAEREAACGVYDADMFDRAVGAPT